MVLSYFRSAIADDGKKRSYYVIYTLVFCIMTAACFSYFFFNGISLIWGHDGWKQHFVALVYYSKYLRGIVRGLLFDHRLVIPDWDFYIGEGTDIVNALHYYVIGDPLTLFSVFVPVRFMHYFYSFLCIFRLYLAGVSFSELCFGTGQKNRYAILTGAAAYAFSEWALAAVTEHPYFVTPMICFPLMILGIEKIIRGEKPYLFVIISAISAVSNFYFFYMIALLAVFYAVIRLAFLYKGQIRQGFWVLLRMGGLAVTGVCIAGIILIPVLMFFLHDSRLSVSQPFHLFYSMAYYTQLPSNLVFTMTEDWRCMGLAAPVILAVFLMFIKKDADRLLKVFLVTAILIFLLPIGGRLLNGMSYMSNRWSWAFTLLCSYILVREWDDILTLSPKEWRAFAVFCAVLTAGCLLFNRSENRGIFAALLLLFITLAAVRMIPGSGNKAALKQAVLFILVAAGSLNISFWYFSPAGDNFVSECVKYSDVWSDWNDNEAVTVKNLSESPYTRISGTYLNNNANIMHGVSSTQYYWTISNPNVNKFRESVSMREPRVFSYKGYDNRTSLLALSGVEYFSAAQWDAQNIPYGYTFLEDKGNYSVYRNDHNLPIGYCYDSYYTKETWESLDPVQKQQAQLDAAYIDADIEELEKVYPLVSDYTVSYKIKCGDDSVTETEDGFVATEKNAQIRLTLQQEASGAEIYLGVKGLGFIPTPRYDLYFGDEAVDPEDLYGEAEWDGLDESVKKAVKSEKFYWEPIQNVNIELEASNGAETLFEYLQPDAPFSGGRHDFIANFGYSEEGAKEITITFPQEGIYSLDKLSVYAVPMDAYPEKIGGLQEHTLQDVALGTDTVTGEITLDRPELLCLAIPYSEGWKAYVDDIETEVYRLNERYLGISIPSGSHSIRFHYSMPYKKTGAAVTLLGAAVFILIICCGRRKAAE